MKIYPIYEFPNSIKLLEEILNYINDNQPVLKKDLDFFVGKLIGKRSSRTRITIKDLKKLKIIEGDSEISLTWETQIYIDLSAPLYKLLVYCVYKIPDLFNVCYHICSIDPELKLSKPKLFEKLKEIGFEEEKIVTVREKLFAIIRIISICLLDKNNNQNVFSDYKMYIEFLKSLESSYLNLSNNQYDSNVVISDLKDDLFQYEFINNIERLYKDPVYASKTSFSVVNEDFAFRNYMYINKQKYYYFKLKKSFF